MTSSQKGSLAAAETSLNANFGGGGRMSWVVNSKPNTASKPAATGGLISISSIVLVEAGRNRMTVARIGPLVPAKSNRCRRCGVKPGCALKYCTVASVTQPLVGLEELTTTTAGLVARVY